MNPHTRKPHPVVPPRLSSELTQEIVRLRARKSQLEELLRLQSEVGNLEEDLLLGKDSLFAIINLTIEVISTHYGITSQALTGRCREERIAWPRMVVYYVTREITQASSKTIGRFMHRDHGSILYGVKAVRDRMEVDDKIREQVEKLQAQVLSRVSSKVQEQAHAQ